MDILKINSMTPQIHVSYYNKHFPKKVISNSQETIKVLLEFWDKDLIDIQESFYVLYLNRKNEIIGYRRISIGTDTQALVSLKLIIGIALKVLADSIIVAHNHPSGNNQPSPEDHKLTSKIKEACILFDIRLLDHLIITHKPDNYYSFLEEGKL